MSIAIPHTPKTVIGIALLFCAIVAGMLWFIDKQSIRVFQSDASDYNAGAVNILLHQTYSLDGVTPTDEREPGYSMFLASIYTIFGRENYIAIVIVQSALYLLAAFLLFRTLRTTLDTLTASISFGILLLSPSAFFMIQSVCREGFTLALFLLLTALTISSIGIPSWNKAWGIGSLAGAIILTYAPFLFFPLVIALFFLLHRLPKKYLLPVFLVPVLAVGLWIARNDAMLHRFEFTGSYRTTSLLHTRALQVEHFSLSDPFRCLWTEYVTRNLQARSPYCGTQYVQGDAAALGKIMKDNEHILLGHLPMYAYVMLFSILEFHLPFVGGWGHLLNIIEILSTLFLYLGIAWGLSSLWNRRYAFFLMTIAYCLMMFPPLVALPRHRMEVLFAYAILSAVGYARLFRRHPPSA